MGIALRAHAGIIGAVHGIQIPVEYSPVRRKRSVVESLGITRFGTEGFFKIQIRNVFLDIEIVRRISRIQEGYVYLTVGSGNFDAGVIGIVVLVILFSALDKVENDALRCELYY